jgi:aminotransferase EvaB
MIKYWDCKRDYYKNRTKYLKAIDKTIKSGQLLFGKQLLNFEKKFLKQFNFKFGIGVGSGTEALYIALKTLNIKSGDEVITVANTAIPTISAIELCGATPVFVDIGSDHLINGNNIKKKITSKTKAIVPVHLYGNACDMEVISKIAKKNNLKVIEDCAQSLGSKFNNKFTGSFGNAGCFSFYPTKIMGSYGDAGFIVFKKREDYLRAKKIRFYGIDTNKRKKIAKIFYQNIKKTNLNLPSVNSKVEHVYNSFTIMHDKRDKLKKFLENRGIQTSINYKYPVHQMPTFKNYVCKMCNCLPITELFAKKILCLPIYPELKMKEVNKIIKNIKLFISMN